MINVYKYESSFDVRLLATAGSSLKAKPRKMPTPTDTTTTTATHMTSHIPAKGEELGSKSSSKALVLQNQSC